MRNIYFNNKHALPLLIIVAFSMGCSGEGMEPDEPIYLGDIPACDVQVSDESDSLATQPLKSGYSTRQQNQTESADFSKPGPYPTWNTSPKTYCSQDPTIAQVGDVRDVALYITYPAATRPTFSGD